MYTVRTYSRLCLSFLWCPSMVFHLTQNKDTAAALSYKIIHDYFSDLILHRLLCYFHHSIFFSPQGPCTCYSLCLEYSYSSASVVKNSPAMQETRVHFLCLEDPLENDMGNPLQYSCLENPMDKGAWRATAHRIEKSQTWLKRLSTHALPHFLLTSSFLLTSFFFTSLAPLPKTSNLSSISWLW